MEKKIIAGIIVVLVVVIAACGAYVLLTDDSKADNDTYYFFIQMDEKSDSEGLPYDSATMQNGFWLKAHGNNASDALQNLFKDKNWKIEIDALPEEFGGGDSINSLFGLMLNETEEGYLYWTQYAWDSELGSFKYCEITLDKIVPSDKPSYIAIVYKVYDFSDDVPPTATPDDIPKDVL